MRKQVVSLILFAAATAAFAQITTASSYFNSVSEFYATIHDYEVHMDITVGSSRMAAQASFKRPDLLRIDFSNPESQTILFNGDMLTIYLPGPAAILNQSVTDSDTGQGMSLATPQGLALMSRYYSIAYETGQDPVPLEEGSDELVVKLVLSRKNTTEGFRRILLAIDAQTKLIRRVEALTTQNETITFLFSDYAVNQGIPDQRFIYDPPSSANIYNNFLFSE
ncbi:MAG TPA: outer-membrane lipoprotein carrier protein LolA [Candidatus Treponema faecavium]|nr:outer-membrane lipoprotein carrier protein LolA [Candidatus Treponema faecavium]